MWLLRAFRRSAPFPQLDAGRVVLQPPQDSDYTAWATLRARSREFLAPWEPTWPRDALSRSAYRSRLRRNAYDIKHDLAYGFFLVRRVDNELLGGITVSNIRRGVSQCGTLGYWVGAPYARCGYMSDALYCVIEFATQQIRLHRLEAACLPNNAASQNLLAKCGFVCEGRADGYLRINGDWHDHLLYGLVLDRNRVRAVQSRAHAEPSRIRRSA